MSNVIHIAERESDKAALEAVHAREANADRVRVYERIKVWREQTREMLADLEGMRALKFRVSGGYAPPWEKHAMTGVQHVCSAESFLATFEDIIVDETLMDYVDEWVRG